MTLTDIEKKLLMLAMDRSASDGEIQTAATKWVRSLRERFANGTELIKALESAVATGPWSTPPSRPTPQASGFWGDIMRDAQAMGRARAARESATYKKEQENYEEFMRRVNQQYQQYTEAARQAAAFNTRSYYPYDVKEEPPSKKGLFQDLVDFFK